MIVEEKYSDLLLEFQKKMQLSSKGPLSARNSYKKNIKKRNSVLWVLTRVLSLHMPPKSQLRIRHQFWLC